VIRDVKGVTGLLDRRFGSALGRPLSIVRTLVWVIVGLYVLGALIAAPKVVLSQTHYNSRIHVHGLRDEMLDKNDPRGWNHPARDSSTFTIAWVGTSTLQSISTHDSFVPGDVLRRLRTIDGKPVRVQMYLLEGGRMMDIYNAVTEALATKPDLLMVDLNPIWLFNDLQIEAWDNLTGTVFADMVGDPANWPLLLELDSPSDAALGLAGKHLSALGDRWSYAQKLHDLLDKLAPNPPSVDARQPIAKLKGLALVARMSSPLAFWNYYRRLVPANASRLKTQEALLSRSRTDGSVATDRIVSAMLGSIAASKIPSIAYVPALDPAALDDPGVDSSLRRVETRFAQLADRHRAPTLEVQPQSAIRVVKGLKFKDLVHMSYDPPMVDYLANLICSSVKRLNPSGQCTPTPQSASR
jgi:hypothetical protein